MPYRRSSYGRQGNRSGGKRTRKRRTSVATRAKWQTPSARNQKSQIRTLAKIALHNRRILNANKSYTDWFFANSDNFLNGTWYGTELMSPASWQAGNRQDLDVITSQDIWLRNMVFNWYISSNEVTVRTEFQMYIVSIRNNAANWLPGTGPSGVLTNGTDYEDMGTANGIALNSGIFKVLYAKTTSLFPRSTTGATDPQWGGNATTTYKRGTVNIRLGIKLKAPAGNTWKDLTQASLPPPQRMYFIFRGVNSDTQNGFTVNFGSHITAISL